MTQKRRYQLAAAAVWVLAGASKGGLVAQESGILGGAAIGSIPARALAAMLDHYSPPEKEG
jgi:hypothetical protein